MQKLADFQIEMATARICELAGRDDIDLATAAQELVDSLLVLNERAGVDCSSGSLNPQPASS